MVGIVYQTPIQSNVYYLRTFVFISYRLSGEFNPRTSRHVVCINGPLMRTLTKIQHICTEQTMEHIARNLCVLTKQSYNFLASPIEVDRTNSWLPRGNAMLSWNRAHCSLSISIIHLFLSSYSRTITTHHSNDCLVCLLESTYHIEGYYFCAQKVFTFGVVATVTTTSHPKAEDYARVGIRTIQKWLQ